jgi:hypothetical protein
MELTKKSLATGIVHTREIDITQEQLDAWAAGACIQDVAPHLSATDREFIISGTTQEEWDALFGGEDECEDAVS